MATPRSFAELAGAPDLLAAARLAAAEGRELAASAELRRRWPAELVTAAFAQAELRARAAAKFSRAGAMLFTRTGLEQASGEAAAGWRAGRLGGSDGRLVELCCGIGGDTLALDPAVAVDADPAHAWLARHNAQVYGRSPAVAAADVTTLRLRAGQVVFVDPARRTAAGRGGYRPALGWCLDHAGCVKAAPGLEAARVPAGWEIEFVSVGRELKEAVLWAPALATAARRASVLPAAVTLAGNPEADPAASLGPPEEYLLDPDPAVTRAGLVRLLAARLGAHQIDPQIAFLASARASTTPFARCLRVLESLPWRMRDVAAALRRHRVGALDVRRRGLAGDVADIRRRLPLTPGGPAATLVMTRVQDRPWALLCVSA